MIKPMDNMDNKVANDQNSTVNDSTNYKECAFHTDVNNSERLLNLLYANDIYSLSVEDYHDLLDYTQSYPKELVDDALLKRQDDTVIVRCYFENKDFNLEKLKSIEANSGAKLSLKDVAQEDWANNWKKYYKPKRIGSHLIIKPTWEPACHLSEHDVVVEIDPGMAFGTGTHETTIMCLRTLENYIAIIENPTVLDVGCGSGILGIAALKLGAQSVTAVDLDENAVNTAKENARINNVSDKMNAICGNLVDLIQENFDIIVVNIVADAIIELTSKIPPLLKENGIFITSGIINTRYEEVKRAFDNAGLMILEEMYLKDWVMLVGSKQ